MFIFTNNYKYGLMVNTSMKDSKSTAESLENLGRGTGEFVRSQIW